MNPRAEERDSHGTSRQYIDRGGESCRFRAQAPYPHLPGPPSAASSPTGREERGTDCNAQTCHPSHSPLSGSTIIHSMSSFTPRRCSPPFLFHSLLAHFHDRHLSQLHPHACLKLFCSSELSANVPLIIAEGGRGAESAEPVLRTCRARCCGRGYVENGLHVSKVGGQV